MLNFTVLTNLSPVVTMRYFPYCTWFKIGSNVVWLDEIAYFSENVDISIIHVF